MYNLSSMNEGVIEVGGMDSSTWARFQKRTEIDLKLVVRKDIQECGLALTDILVGKPVQLHAGNWDISNIAFDRQSASMFFTPPKERSADFTFRLEEAPEGILMTNDHRRVYGGYGNLAFRELEHMAAVLATRNGCEVMLQYVVVGQKVTFETLLRRGFMPLADIGLWDTPFPGMRRIIKPLEGLV